MNGLVEKALVDADLAEADIGSAPRLMEIVMQSCRGRVDACIGTYIALALGRCAASPPAKTPTPRPCRTSCDFTLCPRQGVHGYVPWACPGDHVPSW